MRARANADIEGQGVAADQAARRVDQHVVTDCIALRVEALQNPQRAFVRVPRHSALPLKAVVEPKLGLPSHRGPVLRSGVLAAAVGPAGGVPLDGAEQLIQQHGHGPNHQETGKRQAHLHC